MLLTPLKAFREPLICFERSLKLIPYHAQIQGPCRWSSMFWCTKGIIVVGIITPLSLRHHSWLLGGGVGRGVNKTKSLHALHPPPVSSFVKTRVAVLELQPSGSHRRLLKPRVQAFLALLNVPKKEAEQAQSRNIYSCCLCVKVSPGNQATKVSFARLHPVQPTQLF